jgi:hypothetical protein
MKVGGWHTDKLGGGGDDVAWWLTLNVLFRLPCGSVCKLVNNSLNLRHTSIFQWEKSKKCASYIQSNMVYIYIRYGYQSSFTDWCCHIRPVFLILILKVGCFHCLFRISSLSSPRSAMFLSIGRNLVPLFIWSSFFRLKKWDYFCLS